MKTKATLKKISSRLNLSISTVSRALKDHPDISTETKQRVMELASLLEYEPNTYAINLRTNSSKLLGVIVPVISTYFYHSFIASLEEEARKMGYSLVIFQSADDPAIEQENLKLCKQNRVAGLFVCITTYTKDISSFLKLNEVDIPVIFFDKVPPYEACNKVCFADADAAAIAAEKIIQCKKKKVLAIFGNAELSTTKKRMKSFREVFSSKAPQTKLNIVYANSFEEAMMQTYTACSGTERPDTVFCMSDEILTGAMKAVHRLKLKIPADVALISVSNGFIPRLFDPEITYVETSGAELGKLAFKRMMDHFGGKTFIQELHIPSKLVEGNSI
jgi:LacI family transcriptional regulator